MSITFPFLVATFLVVSLSTGSKISVSSFHLKLTPMVLSFKWNEETDIFDPVLKETTKNVATKNGNVMDIITHSSMGVWHCRITVGHTFMVNKCGLKGMEPMTYIMMRQKM
jgi:hypothetical protein